HCRYRPSWRKQAHHLYWSAPRRPHRRNPRYSTGLFPPRLRFGYPPAGGFGSPGDRRAYQRPGHQKGRENLHFHPKFLHPGQKGPFFSSIPSFPLTRKPSGNKSVIKVMSAPLGHVMRCPAGNVMKGCVPLRGTFRIEMLRISPFKKLSGKAGGQNNAETFRKAFLNERSVPSRSPQGNIITGPQGRHHGAQRRITSSLHHSSTI